MSRTITKLVFDVELGPVQRSTGVVYLHDVDLDDDQILDPSDRVELRDEGGAYYAATVESIEPGEFGRRYRLRIQP